MKHEHDVNPPEEPIRHEHAVGPSEDVKKGLARIKQHLQDNKKVYLGIAGGTLAGAVGATTLLHGGQIVDSIKLIHIQYKSPNVNIALQKMACPAPIPVRDKTTGIPYPSIRRAAAATGRNIMDVSKDAQGTQKFFERLPDSVFA